MTGLKAGAVFVLVCYMMLFAWLNFLDSRGITSCIQEIGSRIDTLNIERLIQNINIYRCHVFVGHLQSVKFSE